jgi:hypothetical protein
MFALPPTFYLFKNLKLDTPSYVLHKGLEEDDSLSYKENDLQEEFLKE